ncbi:MAG: tetrathionate reductase family octaheme c-type cytochrome [Bacteriovoracaceae bacterium]|nr:tetrathionate reductase family octaheme c-type cytochrome [Bacteriovoracaceae bacterium]
MTKSRVFLYTVFLLISVIANSVYAHEAHKSSPDSKSPGDHSQKITADHSQFESLKQEFDYAPDVTAECLSCHNQAGKQIHKTFHWTWGKEVNGKKVGKSKNAMNNYCIAGQGNMGMCGSCHIGYGWRNDDFDFEEEENIDCLACHDTTGTYKKFPIALGHPVYEDTKFGGKIWKKVDLAKVAQNVGRPKRANCLACHANGGGGNGVKHGDTDMSLVNPHKELDVHMDSKGLNFSCQDCHTTKEHKIAGRYFDRKAFYDFETNKGRRNREGKVVSCESCHGERPHNERKLDMHTKKVACASCHIPKMARGPHATKLSWDWSTAGKLKNGKPFSIEKDFDGDQQHAYMSKKGTFTWGRNVVPEYRWYKGELKQLIFSDKIDPSKAPIDINPPTGDYKDPMAKIWPFKIHRGNQPYDTVNNHLLPPKLVGKKGTGAFWSDFDWQASLTKGAKSNNLPFSGKFDFVKTNGYWPIKHMVAPEEMAVGCNECHSRDSRLKDIKDFYLVGRDSNFLVEIFGLLAVFGSLFGILGHAGLRYIMNRRRQKQQLKDKE